MHVILDTNIVISAILKNRNLESFIRFIIATPPWIWLASPAIVEEYRLVLRRPKFRLPPTLLQTWDDLFTQAIEMVDVSHTSTFSRDPKDAKFLQCLEAVETAYLVTGDRDFSAAPDHLHSRIYTLQTFQAVLESWQKNNEGFNP